MIPRFSLILIACLILVINSQCKRTAGNSISDIDGNSYRTVLIGDLWWIGENLKSTSFNDGTGIPCIKDQSKWLRSDSPAYCFYQNDENFIDSPGFLYNCYTVNSGNLCPTGWRIPSEYEWTQIEGIADTKYSSNDTIWNKLGLRGSDAGITEL